MSDNSKPTDSIQWQILLLFIGTLALAALFIILIK